MEIIGFIVTILILLDQIVKYWAFEYLRTIDSINVVDGFFALTYVENRGAAYGIFSNGTSFLAILSFVLSIGLVYVVIKFDKYFKAKLTKIGLVLTLAGALGNFFDRAFRGFVVDMFQFTFIDFPVFNVADICIVIGCIMIVIAVLWLED